MNRRALIIGAAAAPLVTAPAFAKPPLIGEVSGDELLHAYVGFICCEYGRACRELHESSWRWVPIDTRPAERAFDSIPPSRRALAVLTAVGL